MAFKYLVFKDSLIMVVFNVVLKIHPFGEELNAVQFGQPKPYHSGSSFPGVCQSLKNVIVHVVRNPSGTTSEYFTDIKSSSIFENAESAVLRSCPETSKDSGAVNCSTFRW